MAASQKPASRKRMEELAQPKPQRTMWIRTLGKRLFWGDQESMWPSSKAALSANATHRLTELSEPKKNFQEMKNNEYLYSCGRNSVIWNVPPGATSAQPTARLAQLAQPKPIHSAFLEDRPTHVFSCGRSSSIWGTTDENKQYTNDQYIYELAQPKDVHPAYQPSRRPETVIPSPALRAQVTPRLEHLATPKERLDGPYRDPQWTVNHYWRDEDEAEDEVSENAMSSHPKKRLLELAGHKSVHDDYIPERSCQWTVSKSTMRVQPSKRLLELAQPQYIRR